LEPGIERDLMSVVLRKYGVEAKIIFPLIDYGATDFLTGATDAGADCEIIKDEGTSTTATNDFVEEGRGYYSLTLTATEMQAARIVVTIVDTATKAFEDQSIIIETYGHASAQHAFDLDTATVALTAGSITSSTFASASITADAVSASGLATAAALGVVDQNVDDIEANQINTTARGALEDMLDGTGGVTLSLGKVVVSSSGNDHAVQIQGSGTGEGVVVQGGASGDGMQVIGGATAGRGLFVTTAGTGDAAQFVASGGEGHGVYIAGGDVSGDALKIFGDNGSADAVNVASQGEVFSFISDTLLAVWLATLETAVTGTAQTGTLSTTQMSTNLTEATADHYVNRWVYWRTGALAGQHARITAYTPTGGVLTFTTITEAPANGDTFVIL
jgi:hypothetical protein